MIDLRPVGHRWLRICASLIVITSLTAACERQQANRTASPLESSQDLIWSFMVNDSEQDARIKKWSKQELRGLMIVDIERAAFYDQFSALLQQAGKNINVNIETCVTVVESAESTPPSGSGCQGNSFDFYYVITNGSWTDVQWRSVQSVLNSPAAEEVVLTLREQLATLAEGRTCRVMTRTRSPVDKEIVLAAEVVDSIQPKVLGTCATYGFLQMLGLYPFDGSQALDPDKEAESMAEFLLKQTPYGGEYLLKLLYSASVKPGMTKAEFIKTLSH